MTITIDSTGVTTQAFDEILAEIQALYRSEISASIATKLGSVAGQLQRIAATLELRQQEQVQQVVQMLDPRLAEGYYLDIANGLLHNAAEEPPERSS